MPFSAVADEWLTTQTPRWSDAHAEKVQRFITHDVNPSLGAKPIRAVTTDDVIVLVRQAEQDGKLSVAKHLKQRVSAISNSPWPGSMWTAIHWPRGRLFVPARAATQHHPALPIDRLPEFWTVLELDGAHELSKIALQLLMLTMLRTGELRRGRWPEIEFDAALRSIPGARMKMKRRRGPAESVIVAPDHRIPLSRQALALLRQARPYSANNTWIFPSERAGQPLTKTVLSAMMQRMGFAGVATTHRFRTLVSSALNESNKFHADAID